jgi:hypothetical protein
LSLPFCVVVAWHNENQRDTFLEAWNIDTIPDWLFLQQDRDKSGGAKTKNAGIRRAIDAGAGVIVVIDDDCAPEPTENYGRSLEQFVQLHIGALEPQPVKMVEQMTSVPCRGMPYFTRTVEMPVACSLGFWTNIADLDAASQLVLGSKTLVEFKREALHGRYTPMCGMNYAFRKEWFPFCLMVENVGRMDDIFAGWIWQKVAYEKGFCFNFAGPLIKHTRQSDVFANLRSEAEYLEKNETIWKDIHSANTTDYSELRKLIATAGIGA